MKKLLLLTKTLLAAALLCVGQNAWGYVVPSGYEVKNVYVGTDNGDNTVTPENFSSGTYNSSIFGPGTCWHSSASEILKVVDYSYVALPDVGESVGDAPYPTYVGANGKVIQWHSRSNATEYGTITMSPVSTGKLVFGVDLNFGGYNTNYAPQIIFVDGEGNNVLQLGFNCGSGATEYFQYKVGDGSATNDGTVGSSKLRGKYTGHSIRDIVIDMETGDVVYTVDCIGTDGKRQVNTSTKGVNIGTGKTIAGVRLSRNFAQKSQSDYIWADNIELYTVGVESPAYTYTIKAKAGSKDLGTMATGSCKGGMAFSAAGLPQVIKNGDDYYVLTDAGVSNFSKSYTMEADGSNKDQEIEYTLDNTIVFYGELENLENHGGIIEGNYSNGQNAPISGSKYSELGELTRGVYSVTAAVNDRADRGMIIRSARSVESANVLSYVTTATSGIMNGEFSLYETTTIYLSGITSDAKTNQSATMDYIIIRKTADIPENVSVTVTAAGYATYVPSYDLDFSATSIEAYKVKVSSKGVATMTLVDNVPAGTPVLLYKDGGATEDIPVMTGAAAVSDNDLVAGTGAAVATNETIAEVEYTNMILNNVSGIGFYFANGQEVAANRAYLHITTDLAPATSARMAMRFAGDNITGVANVEAVSEAKAKEGKFIENGKLVIVKNGQKFNAAGAKLY